MRESCLNSIVVRLSEPVTFTLGAARVRLMAVQAMPAGCTQIFVRVHGSPLELPDDAALELAQAACALSVPAVPLDDVPLIPDGEGIVRAEPVADGSDYACHGRISCLDSCRYE